MKHSMYATTCVIVSLIIAVLSGPGALPLQASGLTPDIMKVSEIKTGMIGEGRTIFKGTRIETFKFKVLGVLEKLAPGRNLVIIEALESPTLSESGIIAGMSGSPAYIDGKLIGAVAYGFAFAKRPIGGVTPIEEMLETDNYNKAAFSIDLSDIKIQFSEENIRSISARLQKELARRINLTPYEGLSPIRLIGTSRGIDPSALSPLAPLFARGLSFSPGSQAKTGKPGKKNLSKVDGELFTTEPAAAAVVPLIRGDFEFSASGTVTYVKGNKVFLFGHPFFNLGSVDFPLHKAEVVVAVPSYQNSFRIVNTGHQIGTVVQDRYAAIQAELGKSAYMIPMKVFLENRNRGFNLEMVSHPLMTPILGNVALSNIFTSEYKAFGFQSMEVKGKIFIEDEKNILINDLFSGPNAADEFGNLVLAINFFLMNNRDKPVRLQKMDFEVNVSERVRMTNIRNVMVDKRAYSPGELIDISIHLKNDKGTPSVERMQIKAPHLKPGSVFYLMVADKLELIRFESKNIKSNYFPNTLSALIRAINNLRKNNRIYIKLMTPSRGAFIRGHEYSNLPSSLHDMFNYNTSTSDRGTIKYSTITEYQYEVPAVVTGHKLFKLKIKERSDADVR